MGLVFLQSVAFSFIYQRDFGTLKNTEGLTWALLHNAACTARRVDSRHARIDRFCLVASSLL